MFNIGIRKVGGIWFWYVGRFGGSFFIQSKESFYEKQAFMAFDRAMRD